MSVFENPSRVTEILHQLGLANVDKEYNKLVSQKKEDDTIKRFYFKTSSNELNIKNLINTKSTSQSVKHLEEEYPTQKDLDLIKEVYDSLSRSPSFPSLTRTALTKTIRYTQYLQMKEKLPERIKLLLTTRLFIEIGGTSISNCDYKNLIKHIENIVHNVEHYSFIMELDPNRTGFLTKSNVYKYISHFVKQLDFLQDENSDFIEKYIIFIMNRILLVIDPLNKGLISISRLVNEPLYLCFASLTTWDNFEKINPFDIEIFKSVLLDFNTIDTDEDGILKTTDLLNMNGYRLTEAFIESVYENLCQNGTMDFEWFIRFKIALDNLGAKWANLFFFDAIDIDNSGDITRFEINYFQKDIVKECTKLFPESTMLPTESVISEKFDTLQVTTNRISKDVFVNSRATEAFVRQITDMAVVAKMEFNIDIFQIENEKKNQEQEK